MRKERVQEEGLSGSFVRLNDHIDHFDPIGNGHVLPADHVGPVAPVTGRFLFEVKVKTGVAFRENVRLEKKPKVRSSEEKNSTNLLWRISPISVWGILPSFPRENLGETYRISFDYHR